jgi:hypothetical protein
MAHVGALKLLLYQRPYRAMQVGAVLKKIKILGFGGPGLKIPRSCPRRRRPYLYL